MQAWASRQFSQRRPAMLLQAAFLSSMLALSRGTTIELGLFLDAELVSGFAGVLNVTGDNFTLEAYLGTVFHTVELLLHSRTISPHINLSITHLELLPPDQDAASHRFGYATEYLNQFCRLQFERENRTWDHAMLLTGYDLHRGQGGPDILKGRAQFHRMCDARFSCSVTEALELDAPFLIAHELGHSLGLEHDEPRCPSDFLMSAALGAGKVAWSNCSREALTGFLAQLTAAEGNCLDSDDFEVAMVIDRSRLPGQVFDEDAQCRISYRLPNIVSRSLRQIEHEEGICHMLWCATGPYQRHFGAHPALPGSYCADRSWCVEGECRPFGSSGPLVVDGAWSSWSDAASCGDSEGCECAPMGQARPVRTSTRRCDSPKPLNGGAPCSGIDRRFTVCAGLCPEANLTTPLAFGNEVCARWKRDGKTRLTGEHKTHWLQLCNVGCSLIGSADSYVTYGDVFPDGMKCGTDQDHRKFCFQGDCIDPRDCSAENRTRGFCPVRDNVEFAVCENAEIPKKESAADPL